MRIIKKATTITIISLLVFTLSACWNNKDINHRVMPVVMGVSMEGDEYKVFLQIPQPSKDTIQTKIVKGTGKTINHAVDKINTDMESSVDLLHLKVIIIEEKFAQKGVKDLISGFMRSRDVSPKAIVAICDDDFDRFFSRMSKSTEAEGTALLDFFEKNAGWTPEIALTRVWQVYRSIHSYTQDVAIPILSLGKKNTLVDQIGSAVIKNGKMVEQIDSDETLLFNAFNDESTQGKIEVTDAGTVLILGNTMVHESKFLNERSFLNSKIKLKVMLVETKGNPPTESIKKELETLLKRRFNVMFTKLQKSEADILGLGQYFRNKIPRKELKHWRSEYYPELSMDFQVYVDIQNEGNLITP
jgi:Ger(x)C family germination protein